MDNKKTATYKLLRVAGYIRVSTDKQAKYGDSIRDQEQTILKTVDSRDDWVLQGLYTDEGISGQKLQRDDFSRLLNAVKDGEIDLIVFTKIDRWFRSLRHYLNTQAILEKHGVGWIALNEPWYDTTTAHGRNNVAQSMGWAELEAQLASERIIHVFKNKVENGEVITGNPPLGMKIENKRLIPSEDAPKVLAIFEYYRDYNNLRATMRYAAEQLGIIRTHHQIKRILLNEIFTGRYRDNEAYCPRIVSDELFNDVQRLLSLNIRSNKKVDYIFSGLMVCNECGKKLAAFSIRNRRHFGEADNPDNPTHYKYPAYRCNTYHAGYKTKRCENRKVVRESVLERELLRQIRPKLDEYIATYDVEPSFSNAFLSSRQQLATLRNRLERLSEMCLNEAISINEYKIAKAEITQKIIELEAYEIPEAIDLKPITTLLESNWEAIYSTFTRQEKCIFWRSMLHEIRVDADKTIHVVFL